MDDHVVKTGLRGLDQIEVEGDPPGQVGMLPQRVFMARVVMGGSGMHSPCIRRWHSIDCSYARRSLERAVKWLYANDSYLKQPYADNLASLIHEPTFRENLEPMQPDISIAKPHNAIYSAHNAQ